MKDLCRELAWATIDAGLWGTAGTVEHNLEVAAIAMKHGLHGFYTEWKETGLNSTLTEIHAMSAKLFGTNSDRKLRTKGAETWGFLLFLVHMFNRRWKIQGRLQRESVRLFEAAECMIKLCYRMDNIGRKFCDSDIDECLEHWKRFCSLTRHCERLLTPKRHILWHMLQRAAFLGNPLFYANWTDEGLNRVLKGACREQSQVTFEECVLLSMPFLV
ncbi:unnamed protein product [Prorocentrum cordatum]|uniref:Uncharacterized protein n=1 Tax=Prorocentrum cordatum TaxID=2364126 RepID=A0ABN9TPX0_9DINO|nr:unnamed protein product [Polarella glacialis]